MHHRQLELNMAKVTRAIVMLVTAGLTADTGLYHTHLRVHQTLMVCVSVVLVGVCRLDLDGAHATNLIRRHQAELDRADSLRYLG